nr:helix-turn-helix domain-containing protein [Brevibacillus sp. AG162]
MQGPFISESCGHVLNLFDTCLLDTARHPFPAHQEIANMVGATRETVSLALASLVDEGIVLVSRMSIAVHASRMVDKIRE